MNKNILANEDILLFENMENNCTSLNEVHIPEHTRSLSGSLLGYKTIP